MHTQAYGGVGQGGARGHKHLLEALVRTQACGGGPGGGVGGGGAWVTCLLLYTLLLTAVHIFA